jgi:hypothetical protein
MAVPFEYFGRPNTQLLLDLVRQRSDHGFAVWIFPLPHV